MGSEEGKIIFPVHFSRRYIYKRMVVKSCEPFFYLENTTE